MGKRRTQLLFQVVSLRCRKRRFLKTNRANAEALRVISSESHIHRAVGEFDRVFLVVDRGFGGKEVFS